MKQWGAVLCLAGACVVGGTAIAGPVPRCTICHFPSHDATQEGDIVIVGESAWKQSHRPHGDCLMYVDEINIEGILVRGHSSDGATCKCVPIDSDPAPDPDDQAVSTTR